MMNCTTFSSTSLYDVLHVGDIYTLKEGKNGVVVEGPKFFHDEKRTFHEYIMALLNPTDDEKQTGTLFAFVVMNASSYDAPSVTFISGNPFRVHLYGLPSRHEECRGCCPEHFGTVTDPYIDCYECALLSSGVAFEESEDTSQSDHSLPRDEEPMLKKFREMKINNRAVSKGNEF